MRTSLPFTPEGFTQSPGLGPPKVLHAAAWGHWGGTRQAGKQTIRWIQEGSDRPGRWGLGMGRPPAPMDWLRSSASLRTPTTWGLSLSGSPQPPTYPWPQKSSVKGQLSMSVLQDA